MPFVSRYLTCAGYEIHFTEWGEQTSEPVIMWHGLSRSGRDFDDIAGHLAGRYRVLCPDTIGRGLSQWAKDREHDYCFEVYVRIALEMLVQAGIENMRWVGTSMGALIGMRLAAGELKGRISHLLINDIGPEIPAAAATRIAEYVGNPPVFDSYAAFEDWIRTVYTPFGEQDDATWRHLAESSCRRTSEGRITVHYDPKIVTQFTTHKSDLDLWDDYDKLECRTLVLRGALSDVLTAETAAMMTKRGPKAELVEVADVGHAPVLNTGGQRKIVEDFLVG